MFKSNNGSVRVRTLPRSPIKIQQQLYFWPVGPLVHSSTIYGHVHLAKTAGSEINGELAARFERVCGHKGYSYDAYQLNQRALVWKQSHPTERYTDYVIEDLTTKMVQHSNRGRVHISIQREIGYEDCDYISAEVPFTFWKTLVDTLPNTPPYELELHVPCRDPVDWLMSMCNHRRKRYNCNAVSVEQAVNQCLLAMDRFEAIPLHDNTHLKCFNPIPIEPYIEYMGSLLQTRRFVTPYIHKDTNIKRNETEECIHHNDTLKEQVELYLVKHVPIFQFCHQCMGTNNDILHGSS
jgi:hypothetical protein